VNNNITYAGYQYDKETGLYYLNARMYDPVTARFLQEDTYTGDPSDPLSLNLYTYCHNEPIMYTDPTGHKEGNWWDPRTHIAAVKKVLTSVYNSEVRLAKAAVALGKTAVSNPSGAIAAWNNPLETTEAINQTVLKPMVTQDLGIKENSTAYKAIKFVGLRAEGAAVTVSNTSIGLVHGGILTVKTASDDIAYGLVEGSHALGLFGLDDESLYESVHNEMYNRVSENANQWMAIPGQIWDDAKYMFNKNNIDNYYFNPNLPLQDVVHWQQSVVNTNLAVYSIVDTGLLIKGKVANFRSGFSDAYSATVKAEMSKAPVMTADTGMGLGFAEKIPSNINFAYTSKVLGKAVARGVKQGIQYVKYGGKPYLDTKVRPKYGDKQV